MWQYVYNGVEGWIYICWFFLSSNTLCHLWLIYHMQLVLGNEGDFSHKCRLQLKINRKDQPKIHVFLLMIRSELVGLPFKYIILPRAHKTLARSSIDAIFFMAFLTHVFCTCHKHNSIMALGQTLLHGKTISIKQCAPLQ